MLKNAFFVTCLSVLAFACGGDDGSGVSGSKTVVSLSAEERTDVCEYFLDIAGEDRTVTCDGEEVVIEVGTVAECVSELGELATQAPMCTVTVGQYEACVEDITNQTDAQICANEIPASCLVLFSAEGCSGE